MGYGNGNLDPIGDNEPVTSQGYVSLGGRATRLAAGMSHTCALLTTGKVRCWGYNLQGELGNNGTTDAKVPPTADVSVGGPVKQTRPRRRRARSTWAKPCSRSSRARTASRAWTTPAPC